MYFDFIKFTNLLAFIFGTIISSLVLNDTIQIYLKSYLKNLTNFPCAKNIKPTFAVFGKSQNDNHLIHVLNVLDRLGLQRVSIQNDWDILWAHDFPFRNLSSKLKNLEPHKKVNHFPGCGFITNKVDLSVSRLPFMPKSFRLPQDKDEFIQYSKKFPNKLFVEKHNEHRHIFIKEKEKIDLNSMDTFVQEFIDSPYLVDGFKFDIGVYIILTSIDPLRVYMYTGDVLFRYCTEKYFPFNSSVVEKYVVGDDYIPTWKIPSLGFFFNNFKFGMKNSFDAYVKLQKQDPKIIWKQIEDIVRQTFLFREKNIISILKNYKSNENFFELMRFDFVVERNLKVWLLEANMSPNLSSAHFKQNSLLYEQLLYSVMQLVGVGVPIQRDNLRKRNVAEESMISSEKGLAVFAKECFFEECQFSCERDFCKFCLNCLSKKRRKNLHSAFREHIYKAETKRIFPRPIENYEIYNIEEETEALSEENDFIVRWFYGKCQMDSNWCV